MNPDRFVVGLGMNSVNCSIATLVGTVGKLFSI